jgi:Ca-activated chloride channel family protein
MVFFHNFHFLRPWLLMLLVPAAGLIWFAFRSRDGRHGMQALIAEHLLQHLLVSKGRSKRYPLYLLAAFLGIGILAVSGPTWKKEPSPFTQDTAGLVIVLKVTPTMMAQDIQPSRLTRSAQKISDLLKLRPGTKTALIAYSGSSHLVMPFTIDPSIIDMFSQALSPDVMPDEGDNPAAGLEQAAGLLKQADLGGSILLIADSLPKSQNAKLQQFHQETDIPVHVYAMAAPKGVRVPADSPPAPVLNPDAMKQAASIIGADLTVVTADNGDIQKLSDRIKTSMAAARETKGQSWQDMGYWMLPLLLAIGLLFFRRGWMVAYE